MKKHKPKLTEPLFRKEKDYAKVLADPKKFKELQELVNTITSSSAKIEHPKTLNSWFTYAVSILPKFTNDTEFIEKLGELINEYSDEPENGNTTESC